MDTDKDSTSDSDDAQTKEPGGDGQKTDAPKMVLESDIIAVKKGLQKELKDAQKAYDEAVEGMKGQLDIATTAHQTAEAKVKTLEEQISQSVSSDELTEAKKELDAATKRSEDLTKEILGYRKEKIVTGYGISEDAIKDRTPEQLGHLEDALSLMKTAGGTGNYAVGGGGGAGAAPEKPIDRAHRAIAEAEAKGGRGGGSFKDTSKD